MNKIVLSILCSLFPILAFASDGSLSFAPPPSDSSVVFLGNIFGIVDGVLHGTGSQIMGSMFAVFNSAVLALGGIIIMYTLLVSTMNTAHEGQMLGQKWSSIWVPMRSTLGLALLIPKASGYCLMQIFVMWIVLQGVGAADKVWAAALGYLNRGGVIVQTQMNPAKSLMADTSHIADGASAILTGQVCMTALQSVLQTQRENYLNNKQNKSGPCAGTPSDEMQTFCNSAVPDLVSSVNAVTEQNNFPDKLNYAVDMPNLDTGSPYAVLNGICGKLTWNAFSDQAINSVQKNIPTVSNSEIETAKMSRAIAIQQMYMDLSTVAQVMVNNDPSLNPQQKNNNNDDQKPFSTVAADQFGVPFLSSGSPCITPDKKCVMWGQDPAGQSPPLFSGSEFQGAISDYNGIMLPTLNLVAQSKKGKSARDERKFITEANRQGWILAGSYFFNLARLNSSDLTGANQTDTDTGLDGSNFDSSQMTSKTFANGQCVGRYANVCQWLNKDPSKINQIISLINGNTILAQPLPTPTFNGTNHTAEVGVGSSTVYGFVNNSAMVNLPNQPGLQPPKFAIKFNISIQPGILHLNEQSFPCGKVTFAFSSMCLGRLLGDIFYNMILRNVFNFFLDMALQVINTVVMTFLSLPLLGMAEIFKAGVSVIQQPTVNPVIALANMGVNYINFANQMWILLIETTVSTLIMPLGLFVLGLALMAMPLIMAWLGVMVSIGFITAYYIPFLPYMIFTFGAIAWLMAVIEAMVAAPIVALGITHPEGHEAFGKGESAIMILMNVFLRPSMMIIGYIAAIALSYVSVWVINAGFSNAVSFIQGNPDGSPWIYSSSSSTIQSAAGDINPNGYTGWAGIYGFFFSLLVYTTMYLVVVQKSFTLITVLPDKVLRWIGGSPESTGAEAAQWGEEAKEKVGKGEAKTSQAQTQMDQQMSSSAQEQLDKLSTGSGKGPSASATGSGGLGGGDSTPSDVV